jgi:hypothetical protein
LHRAALKLGQAALSLNFRSNIASSTVNSRMVFPACQSVRKPEEP